MSVLPDKLYFGTKLYYEPENYHYNSILFNNKHTEGLRVKGMFHGILQRVDIAVALTFFDKDTLEMHTSTRLGQSYGQRSTQLLSSLSL